MIAHSVDQAVRSGLFLQVAVSSDDEQILEAVAHVALDSFANLVTRAGDVPNDGSAEEGRVARAA